MLKHKKIISIVILCIFMLCYCMPALAETDIMTSKSNLLAIPKQTITTSSEFYYDAETGEITVENYNIKTEDGEWLLSKQAEFVFPATTENINSTATPSSIDGLELLNLQMGLREVKNGLFTWGFNLDCPTSLIDKPTVTVSVQLQGNFTNGSSYSNVGGACVHRYTTDSDYSKTFTWSTTAKTGYYRFSSTVTNWDAGDIRQEISDPFLTNRTGNEWTYTFSDTGKTLPKPRADWVKGAVYERDPNCRKNYFKTYTEKTGKVLNESLYDVHHIQPISYGGDNSYSNLIHLPTSLHSKVTGWFNGY